MKWFSPYFNIFLTLIVVALVVGMCDGCAALPEVEVERRNNNRLIDLENWVTCERVYFVSGVPMVHYNHTHARGRKLRPEWVASDLRINKCRRILRKYWIDHE